MDAFFHYEGTPPKPRNRLDYTEQPKMSLFSEVGAQNPIDVAIMRSGSLNVAFPAYKAEHTDAIKW